MGTRKTLVYFLRKCICKGPKLCTLLAQRIAQSMDVMTPARSQLPGLLPLVRLNHQSNVDDCIDNEKLRNGVAIVHTKRNTRVHSYTTTLPPSVCVCMFVCRFFQQACATLFSSSFRFSFPFKPCSKS